LLKAKFLPNEKFTHFCTPFGSVTSGDMTLKHPPLLTLRSGSRGYFHSECCTGGESMPTTCVNPFLALTQHRARGWIGKYLFQVFGVT